MKTIYTVILAAGLSKRFLSNKLLIRINGEALIRLALKPFLLERIKERFVVVGRDREKIEALLQGLPVRFIVNHNPEEGISGSIKVSLPYIENGDSVFFHLADKPFVEVSLVENMIAVFESRNYLAAVPTYNGIKGHPVIVDIKSLKSEIEKITGDMGLRKILEKYKERVIYVEGGWGCVFDIDRKEGLETLRERGFYVEES